MMIRKVALQVGASALLVFIAWNAYFAVNHLRQVQNTAALALASSKLQAGISNVLKDFTDMETGQRGYLLTADSSYLRPYTEAKERIATDLAQLRDGLSIRSEQEQSLVSELESLATAKQAEMERSINFREQGYRRRAFKLVDSNEGMEYMERARGLLSSLSAAEASRFTNLDNEGATRLRKAFTEIVVGNVCLLLLTICLFGFIRYHVQALERQTANSSQQIFVRDMQLAKLTSVLSNQARSKTSAIEVSSRLLLQNYGGFLPRQGHEYAEQIREASAQMERLRQDLVGSADSDYDEKAAYDSVA